MFVRLVSAAKPVSAAAIVVLTLLLLHVHVGQGCLCPLSGGDDPQDAVSLCAMCSGNEAAVRWRKESKIVFYEFEMTYNCSGGTYISFPPHQQDDNESDCRWTGTVFPNEENAQHGVISVGRELINGTRCDFTLTYYVQSDTTRKMTTSCTVGAECEGECCGVDQECTFSNETTDEVEEGYCTECHCIDGYSGKSCDDINECEGNNSCHGNATCSNTEGSYSCLCSEGFNGDGVYCENVDECNRDNPCPENNTFCLDTDGSYECLCVEGFEKADGYNCTNINECEGENRCQGNATCMDTDGSYLCTCEDGYEENGYNCTNINECETGNYTCQENEFCIDTEGNYSCHCMPGFTGSANSCEDIDECSSNCSGSNTFCSNTPGSYLCDCIAGYEFRTDGQCIKKFDPIYKALIAVAGVVVVVLLVLIVCIIFCQWINRPRTLKFDDLAVKKIDPFYRPQFFKGSLISFMSEYESFNDPIPHRPNCATVTKVLTHGNENDPGINDNDLCFLSLEMEDEETEDSVTGETASDSAISNQSRNDCCSVSSPYIDEQSPVMTGIIKTITEDPMGTAKIIAQSTPGDKDVADETEESDSCYFTSDTYTTTSVESQSETLNQSNTLSAVTGYIEIGQDGSRFDALHPSHSANKELEISATTTQALITISDCSRTTSTAESKDGYLHYDTNTSGYVFAVADSNVPIGVN